MIWNVQTVMNCIDGITVNAFASSVVLSLVKPKTIRSKTKELVGPRSGLCVLVE